MGDFQKNEDFSFSENNLNIKRYERKVNILKQAPALSQKSSRCLTWPTGACVELDTIT
jgi:hypothetical protein